MAPITQKTPLASQLALLKNQAGPLDFINKSNASTLYQSKRKESFLFDSDEAAELDLDSLYQLAQNGLMDLMTHSDTQLASFQKTLLSEPFKKYDRLLKTKEENDELDKLLSELLLKMGPYFLNKSTGKVLEYLIRRFHVQEFNLNALMQAFLPYHETTLFVRLISVVPYQKENTMWAFLNCIKETLKPIDRQKIILQSQKDSELLKFIFQMASDAELNRTLISFFISIVIGYIQANQSINDNALQLILSHLCRLMSTKQNADFQFGLYMVLIELCIKVPLTSEVAKHLITVIIRTTTPKTFEASLITVAAISQPHASPDMLDASSMNIVMRSNQVISCMETLYLQYPHLEFADMIIHYWSEHADESQCQVLLRECLTHSKFNLKISLLTMVTENVFQCLLNLLKVDKSIESLNELTRVLYQRYPAVLNSVLTKYVQSGENQIALETIMVPFRGTTMEYLKESNATLASSLSNSESAIRIIALKKMESVLQSGDKPTAVKEVYQSLLKERCGEDDASVLTVLLKSQTLLDQLDFQSKKDLLESTIQNPNLPSKLRCVAIKQLVASDDSASVEIRFSLIETLLTNIMSSPKHTSMIKLLCEKLEIVDGNIVEECFTTVHKEKSKKKHDLHEHAQDVYRFVQRISAIDEVVEAAIKLCQGQNLVGYISHLILSEATLEKHARIQHMNVLLDHLTSDEAHLVLKAQPKTMLSDPAELIESILGNNAKEASQPLLYIASLTASLRKLSHESLTKGSSESNAYRALLYRLFDFLTTSETPQRSRLSDLQAIFLHDHLSNNVNDFVFNIWISGANDDRLSRSIKFFEENFTLTTSTKLGDHLNALLSLLTIESTSVRRDTLACLEWMNEQTDKSPSLLNSYQKNLLKHVLAAKMEMENSQHYIQEIIQTFLEVKVPAKNRASVAKSIFDNQIQWTDKLGRSRFLNLFQKTVNLPDLFAVLQPELNATMNVIASTTDVNDLSLHLAYFQKLLFTINPSSIKQYTTAKSTSTLWKTLEETFQNVETIPLVVEQISTFDMMSQLDDSEQVLLLNTTFGTMTKIHNPSVLSKLKETLKSWNISDITFAKLISSSVTTSTDPIDSDSKRLRTEETKSSKTDMTSSLLLLLEILYSQILLGSKTLMSTILIEGLFELIASLTHSDMERTTSTEFLQQFILSILKVMFEQLSPSDHPSSSWLRVDVVVQALRVAKLPQTHIHCLMLLGTIAKKYPSVVLNNVMPIITFMGSNILQQDDNYTFKIIEETILTVIPPILSYMTPKVDNNKSNTSNSVVDVKSIVRVLVNALTHIPQHRRLSLFQVLLKSINPNENLGTVLAVILERLSSKAKYDKMDHSLKHFSVDLILSFDFPTQTTALSCLIEMVSSLPNSVSKEQQRRRNAQAYYDQFTYSLKDKSPKQIWWFKVACLSFTLDVLKAVDISKQLSSEINIPGLTNLIDKTLINIVYLINLGGTEVEASMKPQEKAELLDLNYKILQVVQDCLDWNSFNKTILVLLKHNSELIRRRSVEELLLPKLKKISREEAQSGSSLLLQSLTDILLLETPRSLKDDAALIALKLTYNSVEELALRLTSGKRAEAIMMTNDEASLWIKVLDVIVNPQGLGHDNVVIKRASMLTFGAISGVLGARLLSHLPEAMKYIIGIGKKTINGHADETTTTSKDDCSTNLAIIQTFTLLINNISIFLSPYILDFASIAFHPSYHASKSVAHRSSAKQINRKSKQALLFTQTNDFITVMAVKVATRHLIKALVDLMDSKGDMIFTNFSSLNCVLHVLATHLAHINLMDFQQNYQQICKVYISLFNKFVSHHETIPTDNVQVYQDALVNAFMGLVVKLSEKMFKPLFVYLLKWSGEGNSVTSRLFTALLNTMLDKLKSIAVPFIQEAWEKLLLWMDHFDIKDEASLLKYLILITAVQKTLEYDKDALITDVQQWSLIDLFVPQIVRVAMFIKDSTTFPRKYQPIFQRTAMAIAQTINPDHLEQSLETSSRPVTHSSEALRKRFHDSLIQTACLSDHDFENDEIALSVKVILLDILNELYEQHGEHYLFLISTITSALHELDEEEDSHIASRVKGIHAKLTQLLGEAPQTM